MPTWSRIIGACIRVASTENSSSASVVPGRSGPTSLRRFPCMGFAFLKKDPSSIQGVVLSSSVDSDVRVPADLPDARFELHGFRSSESARAFADGIGAVDRNSISVHVGSSLVLLARTDEPRSEAATLEEAVPLTLHGSASLSGLVERSGTSEGCHKLLNPVSCDTDGS